jgi:hypothetical protein
MNGRLSMETTTTDWGVSYFASEYSMGIQKYNYKNCYHLHTQQNIEKRFTNYLASILYQMHKFVL